MSIPPTKEEQDEIKSIIDARLSQTPKPGIKFSPEVNLGHVIITISFVAGVIASYLSTHDMNLKNMWRVDGIEKQQSDMQKAIEGITKNQADLVKGLDKLTILVERK